MAERAAQPRAAMTAPAAARARGRRHRTVAIVGPPNSGKSTLFNRLTGVRQKVANYPGVTVEQRVGRLRQAHDQDVDLIDLPGVYSLEPRSEDEQVAYDVLTGRMPGMRRPEAVILILDSTNLARHLLLAAPGQQEVFAYYYRGSLPIHPLPRQRPVDAADLRAQIAQITAAPGRIYAILWALEQADPEGILESELARRAYKASEVWQGNLRFAIYTVPDEALPPTPHETLTAWTFGAPPVVTLSRVDLGAATVTAGDILPLRLTWQAEQTLIDPYKVTLQLLDARDQVIAQRDIELGGSRQPNDPWTAGQEAADSLGVLVRPGTPPGRYRLIVAVYRPQDGSRLPTTVDGRAQDHIELGEITVTRPAEPPAPITLGMQHPLAADFGPLELLGFDAYPRGFSHAPETPLAPGGVLQIALYWRARGAPTSRLLARLELGEGIVVTEGDAASADYPTTAWAAGEVVRGDHALWLPADLPPGRYPLSVSLLDGGAPLGKPLRLTTIVVERAGQ